MAVNWAFKTGLRNRQADLTVCVPCATGLQRRPFADQPDPKIKMRGGPVSRILSPLREDDHSSGRDVATRALAANPDLWAKSAPRRRGPYLALLPVGLA